jgi:HD-GYP domain-containing protein (c-di-GMP phosphodiesterase class II)
MTQVTLPGGDWTDVLETLHAFNNVVTVRGHYSEGHPAIERADGLAAGLFQRLFVRMPEVVIALIDGEFVVSERPMPDLRARIGVLADAMTRHEVECIVVQRGVTTAECGVVGRTLYQPVSQPGTAHEQARAHLVHVGFRYAEKKRKGEVEQGTQDIAALVTATHRALGDVARAIATKTLADREGVRAVARTILASCERREFLLQQRCHVEGASEDAAHAVNVAIMTAAMSLQIGLDERARVEATSAALVHDIGHLFMPQAIRGIPAPLLDEEGRRTFRHHPYVGANGLLGAGCPALWVAVALEHHRGIDGNGYPALGPRATPHPVVSLVALASFIDRKRTLLHGQVDSAEEALSHAIALKDVFFGRPAVKAFVRGLGVFPPGTTVELSDYRSAIVVSANAGDPRRPFVRILGGPDDGVRVDLKQFDAGEGKHVCSIVRAIPPPLAVRPPQVVTPAEATTDGPPVVLSPPPPPPPALPSLNPLKGATSVPPAVRYSGLQPAYSLRPPIASSAPPPVSQRPAASDEGALEEAYLAVLGSLDAIPSSTVKGADLTKLSLDHRAGFVLTFVDGVSSIDTLIDASGLPRLEMLRILSELVTAGVLSLR